jgi:predicted nucleic acid-binding protein
VNPELVAIPATAPAGLTLVDTSAYEQIRHRPRAAEHYSRLAARGLLATCNVVSGELLYGMRDLGAIRTMRATLEGLWYLPLTEWAEARALDTLVKLAERGKHRASKIGDLQTAAVAEQYRATLLHYDRDFEAIAEVTGQPTEWIIPRASGHGAPKGIGAGEDRG